MKNISKYKRLNLLQIRMGYLQILCNKESQ
jgi:hypothetical protein